MWIKPETSGESSLIHYSSWSKGEKCKLNSFPLLFFHTFSATLYPTFYQTFTLPCPRLMAWMYLSESNKLRNWTGNIYCVVETGWNCELKGPICHVWCLKRVNWLSLTYFWLSKTHVSRLPVCHKLQEAQIPIFLHSWLIACIGGEKKIYCCTNLKHLLKDLFSAVHYT